jgi:EamA domain-containing membrane protein RarD
MLIKIILVALLALVIFNLFHALIVMLKNDEKSPRMSTILGRRLIFSIFIVLLLIALMLAGVITPHERPF